MSCFEFSFSPYLSSQSALLAGVDEVGRGALFGPVVAAAVVLPLEAIPQLAEMGVKDSKQLSVKRREQLAESIKSISFSVAIGYASVREIERINILQASLLAMKRAVAKLQLPPELCLVDGNFAIPDLAIEQKTLVKGDRLSLLIAAASIVAKVWRDGLIVRLARTIPQYDLAANKGYGTKKHRLALKELGPSPQHRISFSGCRGE